MNKKNTKDVILRTLIDFGLVLATGAMTFAMAMMIFAPSIIFSREVFIILVTILLIGIGIGGLIAAVVIRHNHTKRKIVKMEHVIASKNRTIAKQKQQLKEAERLLRQYAELQSQPQLQTSVTTPSDENRAKEVFDVLNNLSDEADPSADEELDEFEIDDITPQEETPEAES